MFKDKYPILFSYKMLAIVFIIVEIFSHQAQFWNMKHLPPFGAEIDMDVFFFRGH